MKAVACVRNPLRALYGFRIGNWALRTSDRGGQDKSRKVRPVGRSGIASKFKDRSNVARNSRTLHFFITRYQRSLFSTLQRA
jgi:hypothetical protein